jgi:hypothetical protein
MIPFGITYINVPQPATTNNLLELLKGRNFGGALGFGQNSPITGASAKISPTSFWSKSPGGGIKQQSGPAGGVPSWYGISTWHPASWNPFTETFPWQNQAQHTPSDKERQIGYMSGITNARQTNLNYTGLKNTGGFHWNANEQKLKRAQLKKQKNWLKYLRRIGRI